MRCVICHPATAELPGELLTSLSRRMGRMTICTDIYAALAECCLFQRKASQHATENGSAGGAGKPGAVLVLVHPRHIPDAGAVRLVEAAGSYAPSVAIWRYDRSANPKLRAVVEEDLISRFTTTDLVAAATVAATLVAPPHAPQVQTRPVENMAPKHLNGTGHAPSAAPSGNGVQSPSASVNGTSQPQRGGGARATSLLTEDELRMLLSGDPFDGGPLGARSHHPSHPPRTPGHDDHHGGAA